MDATQIDSILFIDLETSPESEILKLAAVLSDERIAESGPDCLRRARNRLNELAADAAALAGHNILDHDLRILRDRAADLQLLALPVLDTLRLSPICFPENPYHRLVKDYKLVPQSQNDPLLDAGLAAILLKDELEALATLASSDPEFFQALNRLIGNCADERVARGWRVGTGAEQDPADDLPFPSELSDRICLRALETGLELRTDEERWAFAYVLSWLRVAGGRSVLPPWVRHRFPATTEMLERLRNRPCGSPDCTYCRQHFHAESLLNRFFGFTSFRPEPRLPDGTSLQRAMVMAGLRDESFIGVMPTGGGKSLCFQVPALARHVRRGQLTVVISPLQSLMKDQVDNLKRLTGMENADALHGMLTLPERGDVLRRTALGDLAILYVSPEQLRNVSTRDALAQREIACWVFDEAHCLSKWGHDFRPDYLYAVRFIREMARATGTPNPSIACLTATAKRDVIEEIRQIFDSELNIRLREFIADFERPNLSFQVMAVQRHGKMKQILELLEERLGKPDAPTGTAVVFRATRRAAEETAAILAEKFWPARAYHAGLPAGQKREIQDDFIKGRVRVICATNAFGMGIDKPDVRVVIHADVPGSLENYLQEAGRAGRDQQHADCILLFDEDDIEKQFSLSARSRLSKEEVDGILQYLRKKAERTKSDQLFVTIGEIQRDEDAPLESPTNESLAAIKIRTALAVLERAGFLERNENRTIVYHAKPIVGSIDEARRIIQALNLPPSMAAAWRAILQELFRAKDAPLTVDQLMQLYELDRLRRTAIERGKSDFDLFGILKAMEKAGLIKADIQFVAHVRHKVSDSSRARLERALQAEIEMIQVLREQDPDPEGWVPLNLRLLNDELNRRGAASSVEMVRKLLRALSKDSEFEPGAARGVEVHYKAQSACRILFRTSWENIVQRAERRRELVTTVFKAIQQKIAEEEPASKNLIVRFTQGDLLSAVEGNPRIKGVFPDPARAIEGALLYLHELNIITLQQGLVLFHQAMSIHLKPERKGARFTKEQYKPLETHYDERKFQIHTMQKYAHVGLDSMDKARRLVREYFVLKKEQFVERYFGHNRKLLEMATTAESYRAIVDNLANKTQIRIVTAPLDQNLLILAGPGSGKTRVVVHRVAYLLRVQRVPASSILVCCFNHKAAVEVRRRLRELVGEDAIGVMVHTYHALALRLLGRTAQSFAEQQENKGLAFDQVITEATNLLMGKVEVPGLESDEARDQLLRGFEYILVDEYQDIDEPQYKMISAIAGRLDTSGGKKLSILAVGDDDQNIYAFRGTNVEFIRRFREDYDARVEYMTENYRSTRAIIEVANRVIQNNVDRMKSDHPIQINQMRELEPAGGEFERIDPEARGRVQRITVQDVYGQAVAVVNEIRRLRQLGVTDWRQIAVLARHRRDLAAVRAIAESEGIPVTWPLDRDKTPRLHRLREFQWILQKIRSSQNPEVTPDEIRALQQELPDTPWRFLMAELLDEWLAYSEGESSLRAECADFLYEAIDQRRRDEAWGAGVVLQTVHSAKGMEYPHVLLCGNWSTTPDEIENERRLFYVGMTRARQTLAIFNRRDAPNPFARELGDRFVHDRICETVMAESPPLASWDTIGLADVFLDFAGRLPPNHAAHQALRELQAGDTVKLADNGWRIQILTCAGVQIGMLSERAATVWRDRLPHIRRARVLGLLWRFKSDNKSDAYSARLACDHWEIPWLGVEYYANGVGA